MNPLSSPIALRLGLSLLLAAVLAACGGGEATAVDPAALAAKTPVIRCAP